MSTQPRGGRRHQNRQIGSPPRFGRRGYWGYMGNSPVGMPPPLVWMHGREGVILPDEEDLDLDLAELVDATRAVEEEEWTPTWDTGREEREESETPAVNTGRESIVNFRLVVSLLCDS